MLRKILPLLFLIVLAISPLLMPNNYYIQLLVYGVIFTVAAIGINFIYGFTGYISFAQAAFLGIGAYTAALLSVDYGWPPFLTWIAVIVISAIFGVLLGVPALKLKGHYLAMATIGFTFVLQALLQNTKFTHGAQGVNGIPPLAIGSFKADSPLSFFYVALVVTLLLYLIQRNILKSKFGRAFLAIREDETAASSSGIDLTKTKVVAFVLSAIYGGFAGALYAQFSNYISPDTFSFDESIQLFTMTLLGGSGTLFGPVVGSFIVTFLPEILRPVQDYYMAIYGLGIFFIVTFLPQGIVPVFNLLLQTKKKETGFTVNPTSPNKGGVV
ncbi:branched-chain amino acid ABC transporter permease [Aneurinibacillus sp. Ricciae_BoGa-3]|uniref:branched-chain amino acid ABC transporter permease n=1 Tax=Aneurinibacillus sp. Ricciae_BoGa-3 TaxID=3022697 RepID=UPI002340BDEA|nr:branched-chain amino acid ABC transporter permease [Aneurinibacillus sp. Ricciae_BoGa-3]WCK53225.1 branched-chain amino acid ABC transporter permease [Aneurinibacillus sp. Ricciae_BoGa-3]